jgi:hypothetical protein
LSELTLFSARSLVLTIIVIGIISLTATSMPDVVLADSINQGVFAIDSNPYGQSYEDWTIKWWQWALLMPVEINPNLDESGERCGERQGSLPVFFLAGAGGSVADRTCTVPAEKAILIPVNTVECSFAEQSGTTEEELHTCAEEDESSNPTLFLSVDGRQIQQIEKYRVHSRAFDVTFPQNALFGAKAGPSRAVSDGYWIILEPLSPGKHEIHFKTSLTNPTTGILFFADEVNYHLNVVEAAQSPSIPLQGTSTSGDFKVELNWTSADIGSENTFGIKIMDRDGQALSGATYDVMLFKGDQHLNETHRSGQTAAMQHYTFQEEGSYTLRIENINGSGENDSISIPIQVTPEYPLGVFTLLAVTVAGMVIATRSRRLFVRSYLGN